MFEIKIH